MFKERKMVEALFDPIIETTEILIREFNADKRMDWCEIKDWIVCKAKEFEEIYWGDDYEIPEESSYFEELEKWVKGEFDNFSQGHLIITDMYGNEKELFHVSQIVDAETGEIYYLNEEDR